MISIPKLSEVVVYAHISPFVLVLLLLSSSSLSLSLLSLVVVMMMMMLLLLLLLFVVLELFEMSSVKWCAPHSTV